LDVAHVKLCKSEDSLRQCHDIDLDLDVAHVKLCKSEDSLRLIEVFHDNSPVFSSDSRVWECGTILARCLRESPPSLSHYSLLRDDLFGFVAHATPSVSAQASSTTAVIDLGAGTGIVGLAVARQGLARHTFLTEMETVVPLLEKNAQLNAAGHFEVYGPGSEIEMVRNIGTCHEMSSVHVQTFDWRDSQSSENNGCQFPVTRALYCFNATPRLQLKFDRVSVFASDCVYSPREVDDFMSVMRGIVTDVEQIPGIFKFEVIVAIKLRLHSETNRSGIAKFLERLGEWIVGAGEIGEDEAKKVWRSPDRILEVMRAGNANDDLAMRCGLIDRYTANRRLFLEDVKWKHKLEIIGDISKKKFSSRKTDDIAIFRISSADPCHKVTEDVSPN